jgi:hypothetical protein
MKNDELGKPGFGRRRSSAVFIILHSSFII